MGRAATKRAAARAATNRTSATAKVEPAPVTGFVELLRELGDVAAARRAAHQREAELVVEARNEGLSWRQIGEALGTSPQAVQQRYARVGL